MFIIQYEAISGEHRMQNFDSTSRYRLKKHLARFQRPIIAVYEQSTVITKAMRAELAAMPGGSLSKGAQAFVRDRA